jgi:hypothetical protein
MSSATSIDDVLPPKGGSHKSRVGGSHKKGTGDPGPTKDSGGFRLQAEEADAGFHVWHFFVLLSLLAATVAVSMARQSTPQHLILISLAVGAAGLAAYAFYQMVVPFALRDRTTAAEPIGERLRADLEREKSLVLRSIKELEFDRAMGKLSATDFDEMSGRLRSRAIGIMKQLEGGGYREIIERDLAARLRSTSRPDLPPSHKATADRHDFAEGGKVGPTGVCVCGVRNDADARFCKACGTKLEAA